MCQPILSIESAEVTIAIFPSSDLGKSATSHMGATLFAMFVKVISDEARYQLKVEVRVCYAGL